MSWTESEAGRIDESFEHWLRAEFEAILDNAKDTDEAQSWASEALRVNREYFMHLDHTAEFSQFERDVDEKFGGPYPPYYDSFLRASFNAIASTQPGDTSTGWVEELQAAAVAPKSATEDEAGQIQAMFNHLR